MHLQFVQTESTFDYFAATPGLSGALRQAGGVLLRQARRLPGQQEGRDRRRRHDPVRPALCMQLNIDIICANSSQAKGRVERANGTLQDRLVKEMRLAGI